jgi:lipoprotein signal peptidase
VLLLAAFLVAVVDLVDKAVSPTLPAAYDARGGGRAATMVAVTAVGAWPFPRAGSRLVAVAGGLLVGGGIANTLSLGIWEHGVPNPLVSLRYDVAFNAADLCVAAGFLLLLPAMLLFAVQHRGELEARI